MKIALIQDQLLNKAGSERVFKYIIDAFPSADSFTFCINKDNTWDYYKNSNIIVHPIGRFIKSHKLFKILFPFNIILMRFWNFKKYDLIITSSATIAKYINNFNGIHVCYCYSPTRAIWFSDYYFKKNNVFSYLFLKFLNFFKYLDLNASKNVDHFISISKITERNIKKIYNKSSIVIPAPIDNVFFNSLKTKIIKKKYFVLISRLETWKKIDHVIEAFNEIDKNLIIIGNGPDMNYLKSLVKKNNINFLGSLSDNDMIQYLINSEALIFPTDLEYGLVPIEANALGVPVICFGKGGVRETMISDEKNGSTAIFYKKQSSDSLLSALKSFNSKSFARDHLIKNALRFTEKKFKNDLLSYISKIIK